MDAAASGHRTGGAAMLTASPPPPPPPPAAAPDAETWRLLQELPLDLLNVILCIADALEQLQPLSSGTFTARDAARLLRRVSMLSRWHRWTARRAPLRLSLRLPEPAASTPFERLSLQLESAVLWTVTTRNPVVEVSVGGPLLAATFPLHGIVLATRDAAFVRRLQDLSLAGTHAREAPYPRRFGVGWLPDLPRLHTLRLLYFRCVDLAGLPPHVQHVHLLMAGMQMRELGSQAGLVAGRCLAPLASLPATPLRSLHIKGNTGPLQVEGTELLLNLEQLCRAAHEVEVRCHCLVLACPTGNQMLVAGSQRERRWQVCDKVESLLGGGATTAARLRLAFREIRWVAAPGGQLPTVQQLGAAAAFFFGRTATQHAERAQAAGDARSAAVWRQWGQQADADAAPAQGLALVSPIPVAVWGEPLVEAEFVPAGERSHLRLHPKQRRRRWRDRALLRLGHAAVVGAFASFVALCVQAPRGGWVWLNDGLGWRPNLPPQEMVVWMVNRQLELDRQQHEEWLQHMLQEGQQREQSLRQQQERQQEAARQQQDRSRRCVVERRFGTTSQLLAGAAKAGLAALRWRRPRT